ncbi:MAG: hypothetical protein ACHQPI_01155 [Thermoanaerobaculia bacterium]
MRRTLGRSALVAALGLSLAAWEAAAGPPYFTDDPEPVDFRHWEFYLSATRITDSGDRSGDAPHVEANYGAAPDLQVHLIVPLSYSQSVGAATTFGLGDVELGAKYRFVKETDGRPQIGTFPLVEVPSGDAGRGLGSGHVRLFLPVWLQKTFGKWTTYGGGGFWLNPGEGNRNWWYAGWQVQVQATPFLAPGVELFYQTPAVEGRSPEAHFNAGFVLDLGENHHVLFSAGRAFHGCDCSHLYVAYLLTLGPRP